MRPSFTLRSQADWSNLQALSCLSIILLTLCSSSIYSQTAYGQTTQEGSDPKSTLNMSLPQSPAKPVPLTENTLALSCKKKGNLLYQKHPIKPTISVQRTLRMTDGYHVKEGSFWSVDQAAIISKGGKVTFDLGLETQLSAFTVQADNNDIYEIYGSLDNRSYSLLWSASAVKLTGLKTRHIKLENASSPVRYLQVKAKDGDSSYSISELQAYCEPPSQWPPKATYTAALNKDNKDVRKHLIGKGKMGLALFAMLAMLFPRLLFNRRREDEIETEEETSIQRNTQAEDSAHAEDSTQAEHSALAEDSAQVEGSAQGVEEDLTHLEQRSFFTYFFGIGVALFNTWLGGVQMSRSIDQWADNGALNEGIIAALSFPPEHAKMVFINGLVLSGFSLSLFFWLAYHLYKSTPFMRLIPGLQSWGIVGVVVVFMSHADETLGKRSNWWPSGWEGIVVSALVAIVYLVWHHRNRGERTDTSDVSTELKQLRSNLKGPHQKMGWAIIAACGLFAWFSFGSFHGSRITHFWDSFHYYVGSKYFSETRYHLIYHCTTLAEYDDGRDDKLKDRPLRHLTNNELGKSQEVDDESHPLTQECRAHFTPERWRAFKQDIRLFRSYMGEDWWKRMFKDHGFNPTPVWTLVGSQLTQYNWQKHVPPEDLEFKPSIQGDPRPHKKRSEARNRFYNEDRPRFEREIINLNLIDIGLYVILFGLFLWAFGLEVTAFTLVIFGAGYPWSFDWTGGSIGRAPWLFMLGSGLCFLKKGYPLISGFSFGWALLLRIFPGAVLGGAAVQIFMMLIGKTRWKTEHLRFTMGGLLSLAILVPLSVPFTQGKAPQYQGVTPAFKEFLSNSLKHKDTPLTNNMGYPTLVAFHPSYSVSKSLQIQQKMKNKPEGFSVWKTKTRELRKSRRWIQILTIALLFAAMFVLRNRLRLWEATAASVAFMFTVFELTCYYYSFIILLVPLAFQRGREMFMLLLFVVASQVTQIRIGATDLEYLWETIFALIPIFGVIIGRLYEHFTETRLPKQDHLVLKSE